MTLIPNCNSDGDTIADIVRRECSIGFELRFCRSVAVPDIDSDTETCYPSDASFAFLFAMTAKFQIDAMLARLIALSDDHFLTNPDEINWGDVGTLNHYASLLRQITDAAFKEGEHAA